MDICSKFEFSGKQMNSKQTKTKSKEKPSSNRCYLLFQCIYFSHLPTHDRFSLSVSSNSQSWLFFLSCSTYFWLSFFPAEVERTVSLMYPLSLTFMYDFLYILHINYPMWRPLTLRICKQLSSLSLLWLENSSTNL